MTASTRLPLLSLLFGLLATACARSTPPVGAVEGRDDTAGPAGLAGTTSRSTAGVEGLACDATTCALVIDGQVRALDPSTLEAGVVLGAARGTLWATDDGWAVLTPCPATDDGTCLAPLSGGSPIPISLQPTDVPDRMDLLAAWWNQRQAGGDRVPFAATMPTTAGRAVTWMRGDDPSSSRLLLRGGGMRAASAPGVTGPVAYPRTLALHPTGQELYVLVWPGGSLLALTPATLARRWAVDLPPAAHGLFVDPTGRWLVAETGGPQMPDRLLDFDGDGPSLPTGATVGGDAWLALADRPEATATTLVDLAAHSVALTLPGRFRAWTPVPDGTDVIVATSQTISRIRVKPPIQVGRPRQ